MRKITSQIVLAFLSGNTATISNTRTDGKRLYLHGNIIAEKRDNGIFVTNAGWDSGVTRERLNGLLFSMNIKSKFYKRKGKLYFDDREISTREWIKIS